MRKGVFQVSERNRVTSRIVVPCRFAYLNCWRPISQYNGTEKYTIAAIISKSDTETVAKIREAIEEIKTRSVQLWGGRVPTNLRLPLHDGDEDKPDNAMFRNAYYINAKSKEAPQIVDRQVQPITDPTEVYSGCSGKISIVLYSYNFGGAKGIAAWLGNIQKIEDGEHFTVRVGAKEEFKVEGG